MSTATNTTFEKLYEQFIIEQYGRNFFVYTFILNLTCILFLVGVYFTEKHDR